MVVPHPPQSRGLKPLGAGTWHPTAAAVTMSQPMTVEPPHPSVASDAMTRSSVAVPLLGDEEIVDGLPVLADVRAVERASPVLPAVQAAAAAATGFVAGAATLALVRRHGARRQARVSSRRSVGGLPIVGTRSFLVDVHLIAKPGE
jgi:hypothetical protein